MIRIVRSANTSTPPAPNSLPIPDAVFVTVEFSDLLMIDTQGNPMTFSIDVFGPLGQIGSGTFPVTGNGDSALDPAADASGHLTYRIPLPGPPQAQSTACNDTAQIKTFASAKNGRVQADAEHILTCKTCPTLTVTDVSWTDPCVSGERDVTVSFDITASDPTQVHIIQAEISGIVAPAVTVLPADFGTGVTVSRSISLSLQAGVNYSGILKRPLRGGVILS